MRRIVLSLKLTSLEHEALTTALASAGCTQLQAAQDLTVESSVLQSVPEDVRSRFLKAVAVATATEGIVAAFDQIQYYALY
jgi:hypothetical protein